MSTGLLPRTPAPRAADVTRRRLLGGGVGVGLLTLTAGCGDASERAGAPAPSARTRTVPTRNGPVRVPDRATTVVCLDARSPVNLLDLGLTPVGVTDVLVGGLYADELAGIEQIATDGVLDAERIGRLQPDLIIGDGYEQGAGFGQLSRIAPMVVPDLPDLTAVTTYADTLATVVGREDEGAELRRRYDDRVAELRERYADVLAATRFATIGVIDPTTYYVLTVSPGLEGPAADLGVRVNRGSRADAGDVAQYSVERLTPLRDADAVLVQDLGEPLTPAGATDAFVGNPLFAALPAVRAERVFRFGVNADVCLGEALAYLDFMGETLDVVGSA